MKYKHFYRYLVFAAIFTVLLLVCFSGSIIFRYVDIDAARAIQIIFISASIALSLFVVGLFRAYFSQKQFFESLEMENNYTLGQRTTFYNLEAFKMKADNLSKKRRLAGQKKYIVAFSCTSLKISTNSFKNSMIASLNYYVSLCLEDVFSKRGKYNNGNVAYGFNRGIFLLYTTAEEEKKIPELIQVISANIYRIVKEKNLKVYVQPFYGIKELAGEENITSAIEDAFIARNVAENSFETYSYFNPSLKKESSREDIDEIEEALRNNEFIIYYQPKYSLKEKKFISSEALARWNSPKHGLLSPAMFISKAESAGLISLIDNYIFELSLKNLSEQIKRGRRVIPVSVNFSIYEFYSQGFIEHVTSLLEKYNVPAKYVEIEITETTSQANQFLSISIIKKLKDMGIRVLMDDFGVGFSGIDNLRRIPFDAIKIDKTFADLIVEDEKTRAIVKMLTELGHTSGIEVIIEGVDSQEQVDILRRMKIDTIQGFYYSKPMPLEDYDNFLKENKFEGKEKKK